ncbi:L-lactate dehydrogenase [Collinsella sp. zg1085]|uniref:L-lactate dehydrogenase n=1 Tax=Collinsella sp. zg1085 TaxID=2844380 RepID=UPI001C0D51C0|nr:L-lactate dehydrogenase [Collinsella sp. zg1085]QWT18186.1 L-lactate dehydrogenase [Collinsella sp. zg1085]
MINDRKVAIVGCGFVGSSSAFALMQSRLFSEMVLIDVDRNRAEGEALDIAHGVPFASPMKIYAGDYSDVADAAMVVVTAGAAQKPGETRLDLVNKNVSIFKSIIPEIRKSGFEGILLIVSNPVDVLTYAAVKMSGLPEGRVIGSGTVLDTARLRHRLGEHVDVDPRDVHAYVMGEHGDSEFVAWSSATVAGVPLVDFCELHGHRDHDAANRRIAEEVKNSAYTIIDKKHATYYGVAMTVRRICTAIMRDEKCVLPVSSLMVGEYGLDDICISLPTVVGKNGVVTRIPVPINTEENAELHRSAAALRAIMDKVDFDA